MKILSSYCPAEKLEDTMTELYEGGADIEFILPSQISFGTVTYYRILYRMPEA